MWNLIEETVRYDFQSKRNRVYQLYKTNIPVSANNMRRNVFIENQIIPYFKENNIWFYKDLYAKRKKELERSCTDSGRIFSFEELTQKLKEDSDKCLVLYALTKRFIDNDILWLEFSLYQGE